MKKVTIGLLAACLLVGFNISVQESAVEKGGDPMLSPTLVAAEKGGDPMLSPTLVAVEKGGDPMLSPTVVVV